MKYLLKQLMVIILLIIIGVSANAEVKSKQFEVRDFNLISANSFCDVEITQGDFFVVAEGNDDFVSRVKVVVHDNKLSISIDDKQGENSLFSLKKFRGVVKVSAPNIEAINLNGSGDIIMPKAVTLSGNLLVNLKGSGDVKINSITVQKLSVNIFGSGDIDIDNADAQSVSVSIAGSGDVSLKGKANEATYNITGSGDIDAYKLKAQKVTANISGSGDVECYASERLTSNVTGSGNVSYKGTPTTVSGNSRHRPHSKD